MAEIQGSLISELGATTINGTEKIPVEKGSANNHVTTQQVKEFVKQGMKVSELENDSHFATQQNVKDEIANAQLGGGEVDTSGFATKEELAQALTNYVQKVLGKDLSTNDFTNVLKQKLEGLENYNDSAVQQAIQTINTRIDTLVGTSASTAIDTFNEIEAFLQGVTDSSSLTAMLAELKSEITALIPKKTSQLQNDSNFVADASYVHTDCNYTQEEKDKLAGMEQGGGTGSSAPGKDGATFTPHVDAQGNLSWTNDGGKENPPTQNIKGKDGLPGKPGPSGVQLGQVELSQQVTAEKGSENKVMSQQIVSAEISTLETHTLGMCDAIRNFSDVPVMLRYENGYDERIGSYYDEQGLLKQRDDARSIKFKLDVRDINRVRLILPKGMESNSTTCVVNLLGAEDNFIRNIVNWRKPSEIVINDIRPEEKAICISGKAFLPYLVALVETENAMKIHENRLDRIEGKLDGSSVSKKLIEFGTDYKTGIYIDPAGQEISSKEFGYFKLGIEDVTSIVLNWPQQNESGTCIVNYYDIQGNLISNALKWVCPHNYILQGFPANASYLTFSSSTRYIHLFDASITYKTVGDNSSSGDGLLIEQMRAFMPTANLGMLKGVHLDCGRKYFSPANIKKLIDNIEAAKLNCLQLYMWDGPGFRFGLDDMNFTLPSGEEVNLSSKLGDLAEGGDGTNGWITQTEMVDIIDYANNKGIEIIPCLDVPGHRPDFRDITDDRYGLYLAVTDKYSKFFFEHGCRLYNLGGDESNPGDHTEYANFMNSAITVVAKNGMTPIIYNDVVCKEGFRKPYINPGAMVAVYSVLAESCHVIERAGYRIINNDTDNYWVLTESTSGKNYPEDRLQLIRDRDLYVINHNPRLNKIYGAMFCIWCDSYKADGPDNGDGVIRITAPCIAAFGESCVKNKL